LNIKKAGDNLRGMNHFLWLQGFDNSSHLHRFLRDSIRFWKGFDMIVYLLEGSSLRIQWEEKPGRSQILHAVERDASDLSWVAHVLQGGMVQVTRSGSSEREMKPLFTHSAHIKEDKIVEILYETY